MEEHMLVAEADLASREQLARGMGSAASDNLAEFFGTDRSGRTATWFSLISYAVVALALLIVLLYTTCATAHSWYPVACCSEQDCRSLDEDRGEFAVEQHDSWKLWDGRVILKASTKSSPDGKFHLCENVQKKPLCFFAPPGAV